MNNYSRAQELGADAPELATDLPPAPASAGEPASTTAPPEYRAQPIPELTDLCSGMGDDLNPESSMLFSEIGAEGDPVAPGLRSHFVRKAREEAESERRTQILRA